MGRKHAVVDDPIGVDVSDRDQLIRLVNQLEFRVVLRRDGKQLGSELKPGSNPRHELGADDHDR